MNKAAKAFDETDKGSQIGGSFSAIDYKFTLNLAPGFHLTFVSSDLAHIFGFKQNVVYGGGGDGDTDGRPQASSIQGTFGIDIGRIHSIMVYTDMIEHGIVGDVKAPLLRSFPFAKGKMRNAGEIQIQQHMNFKSFDRLVFKKVVKESLHSISIELRNVTGELMPFMALGYTRLTLLFRKAVSTTNTSNSNSTSSFH
jgi:hypothetical protein